MITIILLLYWILTKNMEILIVKPGFWQCLDYSLSWSGLHYCGVLTWMCCKLSCSFSTNQFTLHATVNAIEDNNRNNSTGNQFGQNPTKIFMVALVLFRIDHSFFQL